MARRDRGMTSFDAAAIFAFGDVAQRLVEALELEKKILRAGLDVHPVRYAARTLFATFVAGLYAGVLDLVLLTSVSTITLPVLLAAILIGLSPLFVFLYFIVRIDARIGERANRVVEELPLFAAYVSMLVRSGLGPREVIEKIATSGVFKAIAEEARRILSYAHALNMDILDAIEEVARNHPNHRFRDFLEGYVAAMRTHARPADFVEQEARSVIAEFERYVNKLKGSAQGLAMAFGISGFAVLGLNVLAVLSAVTGSAALPPGLYQILALLVLPSVTAAMVVLMYLRVPKIAMEMKEPWLTFVANLPLGVLVALFVHAVISNWFPPATRPALDIATALAAPSFLAARTYRAVARRESGMLDGFVEFVRDVAQGRRRNMPLEHIIESLQLRYGRFNEIVKKLKIALRLGQPPEEAVRKSFAGIRTPLLRALARMLADAIVAGGASPEAFTTMEVFIEKIRSAMEALRNELRSISLMPMFFAVIQSFAIVMLGVALFQFATQYAASNISGAGGVSPQQFADMMQAFIMGNAVTSWIAGFMIGVMRSQHPAAGFPYSAALTVLSTAVAIASYTMSSLLFHLP